MAEPGDDADVRVTVEIDEPGVLAMSIAGDAVALAEDGSTLLVRQFVGALPTVTVTDTRDPEEVPDGAAWAVLDNATDFVGGAGQAPIGNNVGLVDRELLVSTFDSEAVAGDACSVDADLFLRTPADVAAGECTSVRTLSLLE